MRTALVLVALAIASPASAQDTGTPDAGPTLEIAPEHATPPSSSAPALPSPSRSGSEELRVGTSGLPDTALVRGLQDYRLGPSDTREEGMRTVIGGYGQLDANFLRVGNGGNFDGTATVRRLVVFVAHRFDAHFRAYAELEWENAITSATSPGSAEVEQAFLDWQVLGDTFGLRAGLVLVPMGIINQWHEPPVFHGVERPLFDQLIIPSTWRELGLGVFGRAGMFRYEAYAMTALDPLAFDAQGIGAGRGQGASEKFNAVAFTARVEIEPLLGLVVGASGYASDAGGNGSFVDATDAHANVHVPVVGWSLDARLRRWGVEARFVFAQFYLPNSGALMEGYHDNGGVAAPNYPTPTDSSYGGPMPTRTEGGYVELAYDVFRPFPLGGQQLLPFVRLEYYDTQADVPAGYARNEHLNVEELTAGLSYRPIPQIVVKADVQLRNRLVGLDELQLNLGLGYMF